MQGCERIGVMSSTARCAGAPRVVALAAAACLLAHAPVHANGGVSASPATATANPAATSHKAPAPVAPKAKLVSKSPYAAWRAQQEQAEAPDTSGHGHRAPLPEGQIRPRKAPQ
jgi:hypothetical protein